MIDSTLKILLEHGILGAITVLSLIVLYYRERSYLILYRKYNVHLTKNNTTKLDLLTAVLDAVNRLRKECDNCPYRKFVQRLGGEEED